MCLVYLQKALPQTAFFQGRLPAALAALVLSGLMCGTAARADECLTPAPGMTPNDDTYYKLESSQIEPTEGQLEAFAKILSGRWWGTQLEVICDTENSVVKPVSHHYRIAAEFNEHFQGALRMEAERENSEAVKLSTIWFSPMYRKDRKGHELGWRTYDLSMPDSNTMVFNEKYRVTNNFARSALGSAFRRGSLVDLANLTDPEDDTVNGFVRLIQDIKTLSLKPDSSLTIERKVYVGGYLVAEEGWILERDYFGSLAN